MFTRIRLFIFFTAISCVSTAQYKFTYYLDKDFATVSKKNATMIGHGYYERPGSFRLDCYNLDNSVLFIIAHFSDSSLSALNGRFESFYPGDKKENVGYFENSLEHGSWIRYDEDGNIIDSSDYERGKLLFKKELKYDNDTLYEVSAVNNVTNEFFYKDFRHGVLFREVAFKGDTGIEKPMKTVISQLTRFTQEN